jgi:hypothetical protein
MGPSSVSWCLQAPLLLLTTAFQACRHSVSRKWQLTNLMTKGAFCSVLGSPLEPEFQLMMVSFAQERLEFRGWGSTGSCM